MIIFKKYYFNIFIALTALINTSFSQDITTISPKDSIVINDTVITFKWNKYNSTASYSLIISDKQDFSDSIVFPNIYSDSKTISGLFFNTHYFWKVKVDNTNKYSGTYCFNTFKPNVNNGLVLWLDANDSILVDTDNTILNWFDKSENNKNTSQTDASKRPVYLENCLYDYPCVSFDGVDDYLILDTIVKNGSWRINIVFKTSLLNKTLYYIISLNSGSNNRAAIATGGTYVNNKFSFYDGSSMNSGAVLTENSINLGSVSSINNTTSIFLNNNISNFSQNTLPINQLNIGRRADDYWYFNGQLSEIMIYNSIGNDSIEFLTKKYLQNKYTPPVNLGKDINITYGFSDTTISAYKPWFTSYNWNTNSTDSAITVSKAGTYSVTVTDIFGYQSSDSVKVTYPVPNQIADTTICLFDTIIWNTNLKGKYYYYWGGSTSSPTGSTDSPTNANAQNPVNELAEPDTTTSYLNISKEGKYWLTIKDTMGNSWLSDTITVKVDSFPQIVSLGNDTTLCKGNNLYLQSGSNEAVSYLWSTGSTNSYITLQEAGEYSVTTTNTLGCVGADTVNIDINGIAPVPDFSFTNQCFGDTVVFTDASTSPDGSIFTGWQWNFGDGNGSNNQNSNHQFADTGIYTVILTVNTQNNCSNSIRKTVDIYSNPVAEFLPDITCSNSPTTLHDISTSIDGNITNRHWIFPDGTTDTVQNPEYTFTLAGKIPVQLIVETNLTCSDTLTKVIDIKQGAVADFSYSAACNQKPVYFIDKSESFLGSELSYKWTFEQGSISTQNNPQYTFPDTGIYTVTLEVNQQINNCNSIVYKTIKVNQNPVAAFSKGTICEKNGTTLTDISTSPQGTITEQVWQIDSIGTLSGNIVTVQFDTSGNYKTILTVKDNNGCIATITDTLTVNPLPLPHFLTNVQKGAVPLSVEFTNQTTGAEEYLWTFGDGYTSTEFSPEHTFTDSGNYNVKMLAISNMGCVDSSFSIIKAIMLHIDIAVEKAFAEKDNGYLKVSAIIQNLGTLDLDNVELFYKANYGQTIKEILPFTLESGQTVNYEFTTQTQIKSDIELTHVCIWALPSNQTDENPDNNEKCIAFENAFKAMQPYPNPAKDKLVIEYIIPYEANVKILLFNQFGKLTNILYDKKSAAGINRLVFDVRTLSRGTYIYRIEFEDNIKSYQIMIK